MRWLLVSGMILAICVFGAGSAVADYDYVDIGDTLSEADNNLVGWGPIEPDSSGGTYGNIDDCRVVYAYGETAEENWAEVDLDFGPAGESTDKVLAARYLDGMSGSDAFEVYVNDNYISTYYDDNGGAEVWVLTEFDVSDYSGVCTVKFVSIEEPWSGFDPYGQVAFDEIRVMEGTPTALGKTVWGSVKALYR